MSTLPISLPLPSIRPHYVHIMMNFILVLMFSLIQLNSSLPSIIAYSKSGVCLGSVPRGSFNKSAHWYIIGNYATCQQTGSSSNSSDGGEAQQLLFWQPFDVDVGGGIVGSKLLVAIQDFIDQRQNGISVKLFNADWSGVVDASICDNTTTIPSPCPDVILIGTTQLASRHGEGLLMDLSAYFARQSITTGTVLNDDFLKYTFYDYFLDGAWYGVPLIADFRILAWNRTSFDMAKLNYPPPYGNWTLPWGNSWSWSVFADYALKLKQAGIWPAYTFKGCWDEELKLAMMMAQNYGVRLVENQKCGLMTQGRFERAMENTFMRLFVLENTTNTDIVQQSEEFTKWVAEGEASDVKNEPTFCCQCGYLRIPGMVIDTPASFAYFNLYNPETNPNGTIGLGLAPGQFSFLGGSGLAITSPSKFGDIAWDLISFLINTSNPLAVVHILAESLYSLPPYYTALDQQRWSNSSVEVQKYQIKRAVPVQYPLQALSQFGEVESLRPIRHLWLDVMFKKMNLSHAIERACELIDWIFLPQCTSSDWFFNVSQCDINGGRVLTFYWKEPRLCQGGTLPDQVVISECPYVVLGSPVAIGLIVVTVLLMVVVLVMTILFVRLKFVPIIRLANVPLSICVMIGALFAYASILVGIGQGVFTCVLPIWFLSVGFVLSFGSFDLKMYRLWKIFNSSLLKKVKITDMTLFNALFALLLIEVALLFLWTFLPPKTPGEFMETFVQRNGYMVTEMVCQQGNSIPLVLLIIFNGAIFVLGCYFSFSLRHAPSDFKDREFVTVSMSVLGFGAVVLIPAALLLTSRYINFLLVSLGVLLVTTFTLLMYGIPKLLHGMGILQMGDEMEHFINRKKCINCPVCKKPMKSQDMMTTSSSQNLPKLTSTHHLGQQEQQLSELFD